MLFRSFFFSYNYDRGKKDSDLDIYQQTQSDTIWNLTNLSQKQIFNESHAYTGGVSYHFSPESEVGLKYEGKYSEGNTSSNETLSMIASGIMSLWRCTAAPNEISLL